MSSAAIGMDHIQALSGYDTPTIANALESLQVPERRFTGPQIQPVTTMRGPVVGVAVTATMKEQWGGRFAHLEPWLQFLEAIETSPLPVIAVFHDESERPARAAMIGEGMSRAMQAVGAVATLCDGAIRDISALREIGWPIWAAGMTPDRERLRFHHYQETVEVAGMAVHPGEIIHADENGALVVPVERVREILDAAANIAANEAKMFAMFSNPSFSVSQLYDFYAGPLNAARAGHASPPTQASE